MGDDAPDYQDLARELSTLRTMVEKVHERVRRLERAAGFRPGQITTPEQPRSTEAEALAGTPSAPKISLEQRIGEYWFAQAGIVIFILGLIFLISYTFTEFRPFWQAVTGYGITFLIFGLSRLMQKRFTFLSEILFPGSLLLLYYVTLRLHFFHAEPIISNKAIALTLLLIILGIQLRITWQKDSQLLAFMPVLLGFLTALLSDTHHFALILIVATAVVAALLFSIKHWQIFGIASIGFTYVSFLIYLLNNPILGKEIQLLPRHDWMLVYLVATLIVFTLVSFRPRVNEYLTRVTRIALTTVNSSGFYLVALLVTFHFFHQNLAFWNFVFAGVLFAIATAHWTIRQSKYSTSFYASFSYIALTIGILSAAEAPDIFLYLVWQSAIVIGTAIWFKSGIIIWANMGIYLIVLLAYLFVPAESGMVNVHFAIVAFFSERLLTVGTVRIKKTPVFFHYIYVFTGYAMLVYGLALLLPPGYVSMFWFIVSAGIMAVGYVLDLRYYKWIGFSSIVAPVFRIFIIDLAALEPIYRVFSFVAIGAGLMAIAIFYTRKG
ncbi:MAG: hypothetical protein K9N46_14695 [Candidatus Marinimicrobia bacterium]|nr:hypothetical protein [Candidatus Neomarinimicrobiota bacterium]MCF7828488.1 hypothetical protein [Candidatus Neomarinimicrobiota bacterium]MCF7881978.1 hypothetical protein [Candidatus Neomarinimicrobiota bacterium]